MPGASGMDRPIGMEPTARLLEACENIRYIRYGE
jgi:hypothetical protein